MALGWIILHPSVQVWIYIHSKVFSLWRDNGSLKSPIGNPFPINDWVATTIFHVEQRTQFYPNMTQYSGQIDWFFRVWVAFGLCFDICRSSDELKGWILGTFLPGASKYASLPPLKNWDFMLSNIKKFYPFFFISFQGFILINLESQN